MESKTLRIREKGSVKYITFPLFDRYETVNCVFTTRLGGVSTGKYSSMNMSLTGGDDRERVLENYRIICECAEIDPSHLVLSHQTHTNNVVCVTKEDIGRGITKASFTDVDGMITDIPEIALVTQYADCTPLIFFDPVKKVIATSHSGWRGTIKQIGKVTVEKMVEAYGCKPENIIAAIGPCIGSCCYEVDDPVYNAFCKIKYLDIDKIFTVLGGGKYMLDLVEANKQILINAGVKEDNVSLSDICTCCNYEELHSHRATNGERGTLAAIIELKK